MIAITLLPAGEARGEVASRRLDGRGRATTQLR